MCKCARLSGLHTRNETVNKMGQKQGWSGKSYQRSLPGTLKASPYSKGNGSYFKGHLHVSGLYKHDKALLVLGNKGREAGGGNA